MQVHQPAPNGGHLRFRLRFSRYMNGGLDLRFGHNGIKCLSNLLRKVLKYLLLVRSFYTRITGTGKLLLRNWQSMSNLISAQPANGNWRKSWEYRAPHFNIGLGAKKILIWIRL
jgi:hypothetical protein